MTLSLPLFLPLLLILCLPCILPLFDLYFTLVFSFILLLCLPWFCFLPSIVSYQGTDTFACCRNQLLLAAARRLCFVSYQALLLTKQPRRSLAAGTSSCSRSGQKFARVGIEYQTFLFLCVRGCGCLCVGVCAQTKKTKQKPRKHANPQKIVWFLLPRGGLRVYLCI